MALSREQQKAMFAVSGIKFNPKGLTIKQIQKDKKLNNEIVRDVIKASNKREARRIFDERNTGKLQLIKVKRINAKPNGIKIMDAEKTIKGMQIRRNKRRKELGIR